MPGPPLPADSMPTVGEPDGERPRPLVSRFWPAPEPFDADTAARVAWLDTLTAADLPATPLRLSEHELVVNAAVFLAALRADAARGPGGPRARTGALQADLVALEALVGKQEAGHA